VSVTGRLQPLGGSDTIAAAIDLVFFHMVQTFKE
jgi:hypothetical protein